MLKRMLEERNKEEGFTLIELLVVIIIIGILAAIAIPVFLSQREGAWDTAVQSDLRNLATAQETILTSQNSYATSTENLVSLASDNVNFSDEASYQAVADDPTLTVQDAITTTSVANDGYCMYAQSSSGNWYAYGSASGLSAELTAEPTLGSTADAVSTCSS